MSGAHAASRGDIARRYGVAVAAVVAAALLQWALLPIVGDAAQYMLFIPAVMLAADGMGPGLAATALGALTGAALFVAPHGGLPLLGHPNDIIRLAVYLVTAFAISGMAGRLRATRREAQQAAEAAREAARFPEESPAPVLRIARDGKLLYANPAAMALTAECQQHRGPGIPEPMRHVVTAALESGVRELEMVCGGRELSFIVVPVAQRGYANLYGRDITENKRAREALAESEAKYRCLVEESLVGVYLIQEGRFVYVNARMAEIFGYAPAEIVLERSVLDLVALEDRPLVAENLRKREEGQVTSIHYSFKGLRKDGQVIDVEVIGTRTLYNGKPAVLGSLLDTTQRRRAEEHLRQSERKYRIVADHTHAWEFWISPDGRFLYNSPSCQRVTGYDAKAFVSDPGLFDRIIHPDDRALYAEHRGSGQEACATEEAEFRIVRRDGAARWIAHACVPVYDDGRFLGIRGSNRDITEAKAAEAALRQSQDRHRVAAEELRAIMDATPAAICVAHDPQCHLITGNTLAHEILGVPLEATISVTPDQPPAGARFRMYRNGREVPGGEMPMQEAARTGAVVRDVEFGVLRGNGTRRTVLLNAAPLRGADGAISGAVGAFTDITERKQAEEALRHSELFYRQTLESIPGMVFTTRPDGYCDYQSRQWVEFTGVPMDQHLGDGWNKLLHPDDRPRACAAWRAAVEEKAPYDLEYRVRRYDGEYRWFKVLGRPIRDAQGRIVRWFGVCLGIEDLKRAEAELAAAKTSAEQAKVAAEKANAAKDQFLAVLSHELRTPLTPVMTGVAMLQEDSRCDPSLRETLEMVRRNVEMEARLIDDLLDMTRIVRGKVELDKRPVELCTVIARAAEVCRADIEARGLHFGVDLGSCAPYWVEADVGRLQQVFWNLLKNAIKFTPRGGCVGIRCRQNGEGYVVAEVNDSGIGIEPEAMGRIFTAFEQAERSITRQFGGLGLGLAISRVLAEMHGGTITAHSEGKGKGASFRVRLPILADAGLAAVGGEQPPAFVPEPPARALRILLVEDHGDTAKVMRRLLMMDGYDVKTAGDVATALEQASQYPFDLILSDLGLPDASGLDLMRELRRRGNTVPGIALSGYGQEQDIQRSREAGFAVHLTKPTSPDRLAKAIATVSRAIDIPA